jgi:hypothetical protein
VKQTIFPALLFILFSCNQPSTKPTVETPEISKDSIVALPSDATDQLLVDEYHLHVYAKPDVKRESIGDIELKFLTTVWFDDYPAKPISNATPKAPINYKSDPIAREYKSTITHQYNTQPINFAGHYVLAMWQCGAPCTGCAIIDVLTGNVYPGPIVGGGYQIQADSRMLLGNPPDSLGYYNFDMDGCCTPEIYVFDEHTKTFDLQEFHEYKGEK